MRDFIARFNKLVNLVPMESFPIANNQKIFFINSMPPDISFQIRRAHVLNLQATQTLVIELEDDLIVARKWKQEILSGTSTSGSTNNMEVMLQKLSNKMISMKRQFGRPNPSF